jgi:hypothetical protein
MIVDYMENNIPYIYDSLWKEHELAYNEFYGYKFIKDLSINNEYAKSNILLFEKDNINYLKGYNDGICLPLFNFDISNVHKKFRKERITSMYNEIIKLVKENNIKNTQISQYPYYSYICNHDICKYYGYSTKYLFGTAHVNDTNEQLYKHMRDGTKRIIKKYEDNLSFDKNKINIYFGEVPDIIYQDFINKHYILAERDTKPKKCWEIIKKFIINKKSILVTYEDNYIQIFCSKDFCYYGVNACDKHSDICTILLYEGMKYLFDKGCKFFYFGSHNGDIIETKRDSINFYQASLCNKFFSNYILNTE